MVADGNKRRDGYKGLPGKRDKDGSETLSWDSTLGRVLGLHPLGNKQAMPVPQFSPEAGTFWVTKDRPVPDMLVGEQDRTFQMF